MNEVILEKDYWVCFILNYLFTKSQWKKSFTFKGGTSLSKCYRLIDRFSEDIDLILDWRALGYETNEPWQDRSNTKQNKFNKGSNEKAQLFLENELLPKMIVDFSSILIDDFRLFIDPNEPQTILFEYPTNVHSEYVQPVVRLEIGALAAWTPSEIVEVKPDLMNVYSILFEGESIPVRTVLPERTFWEKATILHHEANRPKLSKMPIRYARHYYDMYCIGRSLYKDRAFQNKHLLEKVVAFKDKFYPRKWANYHEATLDKIRLMPDDYRLKEIEIDYRNMKEMFFKDYPSFTEVMYVIENLEMEIHSISIN